MNSTFPDFSYLGCHAIDDMNSDILKYYTTGIDAPLCPALTHVTKSCDAACVHQLVDDWLIELPDGKTTMWQVSKRMYWLDIVAVFRISCNGSIVTANYNVNFEHKHEIVLKPDSILYLYNCRTCLA